jgi:hypothetical protein
MESQRLKSVLLGLGYAAAPGMRECSAYSWKDGALPGATKEPRSWRTRRDPFASDVWDAEAVALLTGARRGASNTTSPACEPLLSRSEAVRWA